MNVMRSCRAGLVVASLAVLLLQTACISTNGGFQPNNQFVYPNSNVEVLGQVEAAKTKIGILAFVPKFSIEEILSVYHQALKGAGGANVIVNFDENVRVGNFLLFNTITYSIKGQGAKMEVGRQALH